MMLGNSRKTNHQRNFEKNLSNQTVDLIDSTERSGMSRSPHMRQDKSINSREGKYEPRLTQLRVENPFQNTNVILPNQ